MSLKTALVNADDIKIENGILTLLEVGGEYQSIVSYQCFIQDIPINHSTLGKGTIIDFKNNKWVLDFAHSTSLIEMNTQTIIKHLN